MANGFVKTASIDPIAWKMEYAVTANRMAGVTRIFSGGHSPTPTANSDVWEGAGLYPFQTSATKLEILSASANDTAAGTGARTFTLTGLDANFNAISEVLTLNGVTPVVTVNSYLRVNNLSIATAGSGGSNAGDVTLRVQGGGATQGIARAGYGYAKTAIYTVPTGFTLFVTDLLFAVAGNGNAVNITYSFTRITAAGVITTTNEYNTNPSVPIQRLPDMSAPVTQQTCVTTRITTIGGVPTGAYAAFEGFLVDNTQLA